jgi:hypothetical protein
MWAALAGAVNLARRALSHAPVPPTSPSESTMTSSEHEQVMARPGRRVVASGYCSRGATLSVWRGMGKPRSHASPTLPASYRQRSGSLPPLILTALSINVYCVRAAGGQGGARTRQGAQGAFGHRITTGLCSTPPPTTGLVAPRACPPAPVPLACLWSRFSLTAQLRRREEAAPEECGDAWDDVAAEVAPPPTPQMVCVHAAFCAGKMVNGRALHGPPRSSLCCHPPSPRPPVQ